MILERHSSLFRICASSLPLLLFSSGSARAAALTWNAGNPANTVWTAANVWNGPATWVNGDSATFTNSPTVNLGTAISQTGVTISSGQTLNLNLTVDSKITGTGGFSGDLTKTGSTLRLSHSGGFSGTLTASAGNTVFGSSNTDPTGQTSNATKLVASGGAFILGSAYNLGSMTIGELSGASGSVRTDWADGGTNGKRTLIVDQATDTTYSGTFNEGTSSRTFDLIKTGAGTLTLSGNSNSTWTGGNAIITGGTLKLGHAHAIGGNGLYAQGFTLRNGALDINGQTNFTFSGGSAAWLVNAEGITLGGQASGVMEIKNTGASAGFSLFNFNNAITYDATNNPGTATISANWYGTGASGVVTKNITVGDSSATTVELDFTGQMSQTAVADGYQTTLVKLGSGAMRISAANYFPRLQVDAGTVIVNHANALGASRSGGYSNLVTVNGGTLDLNGFSNTIGHLAGTGGVISTGVAGTSTLSAGSAGGDTTFSGAIQNGSGTVALTKQGSGALSLSGTSSYSGGTVIEAGTINWNSNSALGTGTVTLNNGSTGGANTRLNRNGAGTLSNNLVVANAGTGTVTIGNETGATSVTYNGTLALGRTTRLEAGNASGTATFNGLVSGAGGIVKRGDGTVSLTNASNSFSGAVLVQGGTLSASSVAALGAGSTPLQLQGGTLSISGGGSTSRGLQLVSPSNESGTVNIPSGTLTSSGAISGGSSGSTFTKAGAGTFNHTGAGTWSGNLVVGGGTFLVSGAGSISETGAVTVSGATLTINTSGQVRATSLAADTSGAVNLQAGTLRTNGMTFSTGGTFNWTGGTLAPSNVGQSGLAEGAVDRNTPGSSASAERVREGTILDITGSGLTTTSGSVLDLDSTFKSGTMRYNQVTLTGTLDLSSANDTLNFGFNPYFFRPSVFGADAAGTLILIDAAPGGFNGGVFDGFTGVLSDFIGFTAAPGSGSVVGVQGLSTLNPLTDIPADTYYLEYETDTGNVLFHYRLSASVPEPASAGLCVAGAVLLRALKRKTARQTC